MSITLQHPKVKSALKPWRKQQIHLRRNIDKRRPTIRARPRNFAAAANRAGTCVGTKDRAVNATCSDEDVTSIWEKTVVHSLPVQEVKDFPFS